jgi:DNA-binding transcriptional LysR family regulator
MDIQDLRIFARLARVESLSAVGSEFELSPATISKRLQALETELCVRVFDRSTRSICLTEEGGVLLSHVERILLDVDQAVAAVSANVESPRGRLRVSAPSSLGRGVLAPVVCAFITAYPKIELVVDMSDRIVSFPDGGYDVAIRSGKLEDSSLHARLLAPDPQVIAASPVYLEKHGTPESPEQLARHACLLLGDAQSWGFARDGRHTEVKVGGRLRSDDAELLRHAAIEGHGVLRTSHARVAEDLRRGLLVAVLTDHDSSRGSGIYAVYQSNRHVLPKLRVFIEFLADWFRGELRDGSLFGLAAGQMPSEQSLGSRLRAVKT